jgi:predicted  nucleic acid-binding Zn-ribbon protein
MSLRPQMNVEVKKGEQIITCENCSRILYIATPKEAEATAS